MFGQFAAVAGVYELRTMWVVFERICIAQPLEFWGGISSIFYSWWCS